MAIKHPKLKAMQSARLAAGPTPPREFRIFRAGWNDTYKGKYLFDEEAANLVMASFREHGVDRPIDLEHLSIDEEAKHYDPDARGWLKLAVRNGELWAVDVKWTPDGDRRLRACTQRYISPFFDYDPKTRRVQSLYNVAICAIPATKDMPALVAASARSKLELVALSIEANDMEFKKLLAALGLKDDASLEDALAAIKALQEEDGGGEGEGGDEVPAKAKDDGDDEEEEKPVKTKDEPADDDEESEKEMAGLTPKMRGRFMAMSSNVTALTKRLEKIEKTQTVSEVDKLISDNTDKVPLHMESFLRSQAKKHGVEVVHEFLKNAISTPRAKTPPKEAGKGAQAALTLTKEEKEIAKLSNISEADQLKFKQARLAKDLARSGQQAD